MNPTFVWPYEMFMMSANALNQGWVKPTCSTSFKNWGLEPKVQGYINKP